MNFHIHTKFRLAFGIGVVLCGWGGFVSMQNQVIGFMEQPLPSYDLKNDSSYQRYLGNGNALSDVGYKPSDLVPINSEFTANDAKNFSLRTEAAKQFADLARHFRNENNGAKLSITSSYRSAKFQDSMLKNGCSRAKCAKAGSSEHQLGLALDLAVVTPNGKYIALKKGSPYYEWLYTRGADRGFHNSYQRGIEIDGQMEEGRHRRYLGIDLAQTLRDNHQTFAERFEGQKVPDYLANY